MKSLSILIISFLFYNSMFSQKNINETDRQDIKIDSLLKIDFLSYNYKYLDKDFKIKIPKDVYEKTFIDYKFIPGRIKNYKDSLGVVLMAEFKDWDAVRIASIKIGYTWQRMGYHLWMNENETQELAKKLQVKVPYRLKEMFVNNDPKVKSEIQNLRDKLFLKLGNENIKKMSPNDLLNYALKNNPELIEVWKNQNHR